jgi:hypothetical protein
VLDQAGGAGAERGQAAILFLVGYYEFFNLVGALNSSPWTAESFGGDPEKAKSARRYVKHAVFNGALASGVGVLIGGQWWPLIGTAAAAVYTWVLYDKALTKAAQTGSVGWESPSGQGWKGLAW